jgi:hypothetical protein
MPLMTPNQVTTAQTRAVALHALAFRAAGIVLLICYPFGSGVVSRG